MAWNNAVVTNDGILLLRRVLEGDTLTLTAAAGGTGTVPPAELMAQTALVNRKQDLTIVSSEDTENGQKIKLQIVNTGLDAGYTLNQVGIWARAGEDGAVLFAILQDEAGIQIPAEAEIPEFVVSFYAAVNFSNEAAFSVVYDPTALVSADTLDAALARHSSDDAAHSNILAEINILAEAIQGGVYTREETEQRIGDEIRAHNISPDAHGDIRAETASFESRVRNLELSIGGINTNLFSVSFLTLSGLAVEGVWNNTQGRVEF